MRYILVYKDYIVLRSQKFDSVKKIMVIIAYPEAADTSPGKIDEMFSIINSSKETSSLIEPPSLYSVVKLYF